MSTVINYNMMNKCSLVIALFCLSISYISAQTIPINNLQKSLPCVEKKFNVRTVMSLDTIAGDPILSQAEVDSILAKASSYFEPICMSMHSCGYEILDNYAYNRLDDLDRIKELAVVHSYHRRITIFFVFDAMDEDFFCGYSPHGGFGSVKDAWMVIELNCLTGVAEQISHHMGNLFGLLPTFYGDQIELVDGSKDKK